jgi:4-hydroxymandelate oxidase
MIGRPYVWGLAHGGQAGAQRVLELLRAELQLDMTLCGCAGLADIKKDLIARTA